MNTTRSARLAMLAVALFFTSWCSRKIPVEGPAPGLSEQPAPTDRAVAADGPKAGDTMYVRIPGTEEGFSMTYIPGGSFDMVVNGANRTVVLEPYWIGTHEVTHDEFIIYRDRDYDTDASDWEGGAYAADAATRPSPPYTDISFGMGSTGGFPAVSMTQQAALFYTNWLFQKTGKFFRLPTEAEWTFACLAGGEGDLPAQTDLDNLGDYAWYLENSEEKFHRVGQKEPNPWGLYDMNGNVSEWTLDNYAEDYAEATAGLGDSPWVPPAKRYGRTVMGGAYDDEAGDCTCRSRVKSSVQWQKRDPQIPKSLWWNTDSPHVGFRLVMPAREVPMEEIETFLEKAVKW